MKFLKVFFLLLFVSVLTACGQQKKYISYTVKSGETIKSIAKDRGLKSKDLTNLNPGISKTPEPNTVIVIPNTAYSESSKSTSNTIFHTVSKKETLYSISKKYEVSIDAIKEINNLQGDSLSEGRIIQVPAKQEEVEEDEVDLSVITHCVIKEDTLYNLSKKYELTEDELLLMNPELKDGLKLGMEIIVGRIELEEEERVDTSSLVFSDTITSKPLKIVMMLPYKLHVKHNYDHEFKSEFSLLNIVTDFHAGAMIAVDSLKRQGMHIELTIVDTENSLSKITSLSESYDFEGVDAIIGPLFLKNAKQISEKVDSIPVIAPIFSKTQTEVSIDNLVKVAPNKKLMEEYLIQHLIEGYSSEKIILVGDTSADSENRIAVLKNRFEENEINDITIIKPEHGFIAKERFVKVIDTVQKRNWVVLLTNDNIVTTDVVNNLGVMPYEKRDIQLFGFNKGANFNGVSNNRLARLKYTFPDEKFEGASSVVAKSFFKMYKRKYYVNPSDFAVRGFDVMYDALMRLSNASDFDEGARQGVSEHVYTKFDYSKRLLGSVEYEGVFLLQYQKNLELLSLK
ncbi:MAG: LysM peptidoglycan-binding domain-containing protein [Flavobacteriaceae bacterium]|nr:LysM peptidoglycan-binding domain-containing protein [Flavobacteriaceae bacterium]